MAQRSLAEEATRPLVLIAFSVLLAFLCYLYYRFVHSPYQVFSGTGVKGPKPRLLVGNNLEYFRMGELQVYNKFYETYGPVFGLYMGTRPVVVVADPTLVDAILTADRHTFTIDQQEQFLNSTLRIHGLPAVQSTPGEQQLKMEPEQHRKARKCLRSILFLPRLLKLMVPAVLHNCDTLLIETLDKSLSSPSVDIWSVYEPYCLKVVLDLVGLSSGKHSQEVSSALSAYFTAVNRTGVAEFLLKTLFGSGPCLEEMIRGWSRQTKSEDQFNNLVGVVSSAVHHAKADHQHTTIKRNYLQVLLDQPLTEDQVVSHCLLVLLVGYQTILTCLSATTYHLAADPMHQQKLHSEVSTCVQRETMYYETVDSLEFLDAVVQEIMRLHCLTPKLSRVCMKDYSVRGATITKGTRVEIPLDFIHHLHSHWENPHSFSPDRFTKRHRPTHHYRTSSRCPVDTNTHSTFLPFGRGSHSCLGMKLTVSCVKLTLVEVLQRFRFSRPQNKKGAVQLQVCSGSFRRPAGGLYLRVATRNKLKRLMSFATIVQTTMDKQPDSDNTSSSS